MARNKNKNNPKFKFLLFGPRTSLGWTIKSRITREKGDDLVNRRIAIEIPDDNGNLLGYQLRKDRMPNDPMPTLQTILATITKSEMEINAGTYGESRTVRLSEQQRTERAKQTHPHTGKYLPEEDRIEKVIGKIVAWPEVGDTKAPCVRAKAWPVTVHAKTKPVRKRWRKRVETVQAVGGA